MHSKPSHRQFAHGLPDAVTSQRTFLDRQLRHANAARLLIPLEVAQAGSWSCEKGTAIGGIVLCSIGPCPPLFDAIRVVSLGF